MERRFKATSSNPNDNDRTVSGYFRSSVESLRRLQPKMSPQPSPKKGRRRHTSEITVPPFAQIEQAMHYQTMRHHQQQQQQQQLQLQQQQLQQQQLQQQQLIQQQQQLQQQQLQQAPQYIQFYQKTPLQSPGKSKFNSKLLQK
ncbi:hypothetical protein CEXT_472691 [Caerostris extrusa]|uniref:Uncharacterized protein n=1 Tax=Caerostris extrusa TaxID=172846 RepID=A0AAV4R0S4_CAEEX|nr:hypothetical protein CEXT_472691 [Caerostris extrusa]